MLREKTQKDFIFSHLHAMGYRLYKTKILHLRHKSPRQKPIIIINHI